MTTPAGKGALGRRKGELAAAVAREILPLFCKDIDPLEPPAHPLSPGHIFIHRVCVAQIEKLASVEAYVRAGEPGLGGPRELWTRTMCTFMPPFCTKTSGACSMTGKRLCEVLRVALLALRVVAVGHTSIDCLCSCQAALHRREKKRKAETRHMPLATFSNSRTNAVQRGARLSVRPEPMR